MNQRCRSSTLLPLCQSPPFLPLFSWISQRLLLIIHELVSVCSCAPKQRKKKGGVSQWARVTTLVYEPVRTPVCARVSVWVWNRGSGIEETLRLMLKRPPLLHCRCSHLNLLLSGSAGAFCSSKLGLLVTAWMCEWDAWKEMLAKEWLMRTSAPVWRVTPLCPYHHYLGRIGRLAFPRQL